jgi:hypothetical protein
MEQPVKQILVVVDLVVDLVVVLLQMLLAVLVDLEFVFLSMNMYKVLLHPPIHSQHLVEQLILLVMDTNIMSSNIQTLIISKLLEDQQLLKS